MEHHFEGPKGILSNTGIISLLLGIVAISVALNLYYASVDKPILSIDWLSSTQHTELSVVTYDTDTVPVAENAGQQQSFWVHLKIKFLQKINWVPKAIGYLLLAQFAIACGWLVISAKKLYREKKEAPLALLVNPEDEERLKEQYDKIKNELFVYLSAVDSELLKKMKQTHVKIPIGDLAASKGYTSIFDCFFSSFREKWNPALKEQFQTAVTPPPNNRITTPWLSWRDYFSGAVLAIGGPSLLLFLAGYAIVFLK